MAITKKPAAKPAATVDTFISAAPDASAEVKPGGVKKGNKQQISLTIAPELLARADALADAQGQTRAALFNRAVYQLVESEERKARE